MTRRLDSHPFVNELQQRLMTYLAKRYQPWLAIAPRSVAQMGSVANSRIGSIIVADFCRSLDIPR